MMDVFVVIRAKPTHVERLGIVGVMGMHHAVRAAKGLAHTWLTELAALNGTLYEMPRSNFVRVVFLVFSNSHPVASQSFRASRFLARPPTVFDDVLSVS